MVIIENGWRAAGLEFLHPGVGEGKSYHEGTLIMILQHKYIIRLLPLRRLIHWNDVYLVALGLRHLPESQNHLVAKLVGLLVLSGHLELPRLLLSILVKARRFLNVHLTKLMRLNLSLTTSKSKLAMAFNCN